MAERFEFLVVGGGIAGVSVGYELARDGRVCVIEREEQLAFHATGRSAAIFMETYGNAPVRALTSASRPFYAAPPDGFAEEPLTSPRGALFFADDAHLGQLRAHFDAVRAIVHPSSGSNATPSPATCHASRPAGGWQGSSSRAPWISTSTPFTKGTCGAFARAGASCARTRRRSA